MQEEMNSDSYAHFVAHLKRLVAEKAMCTIHYTTNDKRTGVIVFKEGDIVFVTCATSRGTAALDLLRQSSSVQYRTTAFMSLSAPNLPDTKAILSQLDTQPQAAVSAGTRAKRSVKTAAAVSRSGLEPKAKKALEKALNDIVGPMANFMMQDHVDDAANLKEALNNISQELSAGDMETLQQNLTRYLA